MGNYECTKLETRNRIKQSFWGLYKTRNIEKITVQNITDACGIYRTTFYLHFTDVYAILEEIEGEVFQKLTEIRTDMERREYIHTLQSIYTEDIDYMKILLDERRNPEFAGRYKSELTARICCLYKIDIQTLKPDSIRIVRKTFSMIIDLIFAQKDLEESFMEDVVEIVEGYLNRGIINTINEKM